MMAKTRIGNVLEQLTHLSDQDGSVGPITERSKSPLFLVEKGTHDFRKGPIRIHRGPLYSTDSITRQEYSKYDLVAGEKAFKDSLFTFYVMDTKTGELDTPHGVSFAEAILTFEAIRRNESLQIRTEFDDDIKKAGGGQLDDLKYKSSLKPMTFDRN